jgi:hypothetical protein
MCRRSLNRRQFLAAAIAAPLLPRRLALAGTRPIGHAPILA